MKFTLLMNDACLRTTQEGIDDLNSRADTHTHLRQRERGGESELSIEKYEKGSFRITNIL